MIEVTLGVTFSRNEEKKFIKHIQEVIVNEIHDRVVQNISQIGNAIRMEVEKIRTSKEATALMNDPKFRAQLGIYSHEAVITINKIIDLIVKNMQIDIKVDPNKRWVEITLGLIKDGYDEILSIDEAQFIQTFYENEKADPKRPYTIKWLEWLLLKGHDAVVELYHVTYKIKPKTISRTGVAIMGKGGEFHIPSDYAGTFFDNFITRSLDQVGEVFKQELIKVIF